MEKACPMPKVCPLFAIIIIIMNNTIRRVNRTKEEARTSYDGSAAGTT